MAFLPAAGKNGSVLVGTVSYPFKNWSMAQEGKMVETSNFTTGGYRTYTTGLMGATLSFDGPIDIGPAGSGGGAPLVLETAYTFTLGVSANVTYVVSAIVSKLDISQDVDACGQVKVSAQVTGSFNSYIT